jgi:hypothetical protein
VHQRAAEIQVYQPVFLRFFGYCRFAVGFGGGAFVQTG